MEISRCDAFLLRVDGEFAMTDGLWVEQCLTLLEVKPSELSRDLSARLPRGRKISAPLISSWKSGRTEISTLHETLIKDYFARKNEERATVGKSRVPLPRRPEGIQTMLRLSHGCPVPPMRGLRFPGETSSARWRMRTALALL